MQKVALLTTVFTTIATGSSAATSNAWKACNNVFEEKKSIAACTKIIETNKGSSKLIAVAYRNRSKAYSLYFQEGNNRFKLAVADITRAIEIDPNNAYDYNMRGTFYGSLGQFDLAMSDFNELIRLDPGNPLGYHQRGEIYTHKSRPDLAIAEYNKAIQIKSQKGKSGSLGMEYKARGEAYIDIGQYDKSINDLTRAIRLTTHNHLMYAIRGRAYYEKGLYKQAIDDFSKTIQNTTTGNGNAYLFRGYTYLMLGKLNLAKTDFKKAIRLIQESIELWPNRYDYWKHLGFAWEGLGEKSNAITAYNRAVTLNPSCQECRRKVDALSAPPFKSTK